MVDFVEISGGIAEQSASKLHSKSERIVGTEFLRIDFGCKFMTERRYLRRWLCEKCTWTCKVFFTDVAKRTQKLNSSAPVQLSGGFGCLRPRRTRQCCSIEPSLPKDTLKLDLPEDIAIALPHIVRGQWLARWIPVKVVGSRLAIRFFH
jgi:hypothetical protein